MSQRLLITALTGLPAFAGGEGEGPEPALPPAPR